MSFKFFILNLILCYSCMAEMTSAKIKILCLHGYQQNARIMMEKTGALRKFLKNAEFQSIDAPFNVSNDTEDEKDPRSWYSTNENHTCDWSEKDDCFGLEKSLEAINNKYEKDGPFHGLLGFSQGAAFAALVCAIDQMNGIKRFNFVIVISGFKSFTSSHSKFFEKIIHIPSLHVIGVTDARVEKHLSEELAKCFDAETCRTVMHEKGHMIPCDKDTKFVFKNFIEKYSNLNQPSDLISHLHSQPSKL